jgi:hypothetical protein
MDPNKSISGLDPKLQETYNRIMSAATPPAAPAPGAVAGQVTPPVNATAAPAVDQASAIPQPTGTPVQPQPSVNPYAQAAAATPVTTAPTIDLPTNKAPSTSLIRALYIGGAVVFFIAYTIFWIKIFNLPVPLPF